ncbi:SigE family RNA polymerase sigma factor [Knoellia sp. LjRoot47]|uniref:SigE family RNA polymerase sigma factor n=1 Tax=Knoellia sp. LjRoot47 TaxID=3342330 RepID=UPI003ECF1588
MSRDDAFTDFVEQTRPGLLRAARLLCTGDEPRAEDLVQQVLVRLYVRWPVVARTDDPMRYAHRSLVNAFIDDTRRAHRRREWPADDLTNVEVVGGDGDGSDPVVRDRVLRALAALPPGQRAVVVLRHWLDWSVEQTAHALDISTGSVKSQNHKALASLRIALPELSPTLTHEGTPS